jgi:hypothetical protein
MNENIMAEICDYVLRYSNENRRSLSAPLIGNPGFLTVARYYK